MSPDPVEVVKRGYDAYARRDLAAAFAMLDDDIEVMQTPELPWGGHHRGVEAAKAFFARIASEIDAVPQPEYYIRAGEDVVAVGRLRGRTRRTDREIDIAIVHVWTLRSGRAVRFQAYVDTPAVKALLAGE